MPTPWHARAFERVREAEQRNAGEVERTARALFYWSMAREGYWLCEYVSISRILRTARAQYARSYLYTETDDHDTTYFLLYQMRILLRAIANLHEYLAKKVEQMHDAARSDLLKRAGRYYTGFHPVSLTTRG
jgi:Fic family protein